MPASLRDLDEGQPGRRLTGINPHRTPAAPNIPAMPWDEDRYPASMSHLPARVRRKAIEIANALLEEGYDEGKAIRIAIAKAKEWAARHPAGGES
jgi:hypothetical protein